MFFPWPPSRLIIPAIAGVASSHNIALAAGGRLIRVLRLLDLCNEQLKGLGYVLVVASTRLGPGAIVFLGQLLALLGGDLTLFGAQIGLVADDDDGDPLDALTSVMSAESAGARAETTRQDRR